jgi:hypothetical protein
LGDEVDTRSLRLLKWPHSSIPSVVQKKMAVHCHCDQAGREAIETGVDSDALKSVTSSDGEFFGIAQKICT